MSANFEGLRLPQLVDALPVGVFILDAQGHAIYANTMAEAMLGRSIMEGDRATNLSERYAAYVAGTNEPYPTERMPIIRALHGENATIDDMEIDRHGVRIALEVTGTPLYDRDGSLLYAVAVFQDITARRRANKLERANKAKNVFLMNISHELRTPLNHIIGFNELLAERIEEPRSRKLAVNAGASGRELLDKINDLLELARTEADPFIPAAERFDFDRMLSDLLSVATATFHVEEPIGEVVGDRDLTTHIVSVIMQRAGENPIRVTKTEEWVVLSIEDARLAARVRAVAHLYGEEHAPDHLRFQQMEIDLRLAVVRTETRIIGGDIHAEGDCVEVRIPRTRRH